MGSILVDKLEPIQGYSLASARTFWHQKNMMSISSAQKKGRGRPAVGAKPINVRFPPAELEALDAYIATQQQGEVTRPAVIRSIIRTFLANR
jgi:hypothetical protein